MLSIPAVYFIDIGWIMLSWQWLLNSPIKVKMSCSFSSELFGSSFKLRIFSKVCLSISSTLWIPLYLKICSDIIVYLWKISNCPFLNLVALSWNYLYWTIDEKLKSSACKITSVFLSILLYFMTFHSIISSNSKVLSRIPSNLFCLWLIFL